MSATLWLALLLQFASVVLLRFWLGKTWLRRPVTLLVLASVVYGGLSQVPLSFPSVAQWDNCRKGIQPAFISDATLVMSAGMLAFTVAYLLARPARGNAPPGDTALAARVLDWRLLALACAPLAVLTYEGRGYNAATQVGATGALASGFTPSAGSSLATGFFTVLAVLTAFSFVLRHGGRWFLPVLLAQSALLAAAGERLPVIMDAVTLAVLLTWSGMRPRRGQILAALALTLTAVLAVGGVRAEQGRGLFTSDTGLAARMSALGNAVTGPGPRAGADSPGLLAQAAGRLDGTAFAGAVLQAGHSGQPRLSPGYVAESLLIVVPSALWPSKLGHGLGLDPYDAQIYGFGLQQVNFLPGFAGLYTGFLSPPWLVLFLAGAGLLTGRGERWLLRRRSPARLVLLAGAVIAVLSYEGGLPGMLSPLRGAAVIAAAVAAACLAARCGRPAFARRFSGHPALAVQRVPAVAE